MWSRSAQAEYFSALTMREAPKCGRIYYRSPSILASPHWLVKPTVESENAEHMEKVEEGQRFSHVSHVKKTLHSTGKICSDSRLELALLAHATVCAQYVCTCGRLFSPVFSSWASQFREVLNTAACSQRKGIFKVFHVHKVFP